MLILTTPSGARLVEPDAIIEIVPHADGCSIRLMATSGWLTVREDAAQVALMKKAWRTGSFRPTAYALKAVGTRAYESVSL